MTKKELVNIVSGVVSQIAKAHGLPEGKASEDMARTLLGMAVQRNATLLVGATSPPAPKPPRGWDKIEGGLESLDSVANALR